MIINPYAFGKTEFLIDRTLGTNIGDMTNGGGLAAAFDGNSNQASSSCALKNASAIGWLGKSLASPSIFGRAVIHGSNDLGFVNSVGKSTFLTIYGKQGSAPANAIDGTILGNVNFADTANESAGREVLSNNLTTAWDHLWVRTSYAAGAPTPSTVRISELVLFELA